MDMDDVAPPTLKRSDAKWHASLWYSFLLEDSLYVGVNEIISFQKLVGNLDKMTVANLDRVRLSNLEVFCKTHMNFSLGWVPFQDPLIQLMSHQYNKCLTIVTVKPDMYDTLKYNALSINQTF